VQEHHHRAGALVEAQVHRMTLATRPDHSAVDSRRAASMRSS